MTLISDRHPTRQFWALLSVAIGVLAGCAGAGEINQFGGNTMGTTYQVTYGSAGISKKVEARMVEDLLADINQSFSTYIDTSVISRINASTDTGMWHTVDRHFEIVFRRAREIYKD